MIDIDAMIKKIKKEGEKILIEARTIEAKFKEQGCKSKSQSDIILKTSGVVTEINGIMGRMETVMVGAQSKALQKSVTENTKKLKNIGDY